MVATASHPGWTATNLMADSALVSLGSALFAQRPLPGALPTLRAATDPDAGPDDYFGPGSWFEMRGAPAAAQRSKTARDEAVAHRLWELSQQLTGVRYLTPEA